MTIRIPVDFSAVEEYELIAAGVYSSVVEQLTYLEAQSEDKFPQIQINYTLTDDEVEGRKLSQWLSFSPKALFRMKAWFDAFEVDVDELEIDEETGVVLNPDLSGAVVDIKVGVEPHYLDKNRKVNKIDGAPRVISVPDAPPKPKAKVQARVLPRGASRDEEPQEKSRARSIR